MLKDTAPIFCYTIPSFVAASNTVFSVLKGFYPHSLLCYQWNGAQYESKLFGNPVTKSVTNSSMQQTDCCWQRFPLFGTEDM
jgi:hypothetical protein